MTFQWGTGKEINEDIERRMFEFQAKNFKWEKRLSIRPRHCYWSGEIITPFTYAMVSSPKPTVVLPSGNALDDLQIEEHITRTYIQRWLTLETYVYLALTGVING